MSETGIKISKEETDRLQKLRVYDGIKFHLYAVEDEDDDDVHMVMYEGW